MAKRKRRGDPTVQQVLDPLRTHCEGCGGRLWVAYANTRTVVTLDGPVHLTSKIRRCQTPTCALYHRPYRPEEEGGLALPHGEFGLDVIAWIGTPRFGQSAQWWIATTRLSLAPTTGEPEEPPWVSQK